MISVVMAYYNRLPQLKYTLKTISNSTCQDFEIVIVDDFSFLEHSLDNIQLEFKSLNIKVIKMKDLKPKKDYVGPSIPYNVGFRHAIGDKIIIQNPECCHMGDIILYTNNYLTDEKYLSFHCWASGKRELQDLYRTNKFDINKSVGKWYNHKTYRPVSYHFTAAITKNNLIELNGFDERYAYGFNYDDEEFVCRIKKKDLDICYVNDPWVVHQYHGKAFNNPLNPLPRQDNFVVHKENLMKLEIRANNRESII